MLGKTISALALSLFATLTVACAIEQSPDEAIDEGANSRTAQAAAEPNALAPEGTTPNATCPPAGLCSKATQYCAIYGGNWCVIEDQCAQCYPPNIADDSENASCPGAGTCAKARENCPLYGGNWCTIVAKCDACGSDTL